MAELAYCDSWFWKRREAVEPLSESEARARHARREEYTVAVGGFEAPTAIVEVVNRMVAVSFLDKLLREHQTFKYREEEPGRIRLTSAVRRRYCEATPALAARLRAGRKDPRHDWGQFLADIDRVLEGTSVHFSQDGPPLRLREHFAEPYSLDRTDLPAPGQVIWEPYPEFGQYDHLLRRDRDIPWGPGLDGP